MSDKQKFAFDKVNFILLAVGMAIVIIGFLLMTDLRRPKRSLNLIFSVHVELRWRLSFACSVSCR